MSYSSLLYLVLYSPKQTLSYYPFPLSGTYRVSPLLLLKKQPALQALIPAPDLHPNLLLSTGNPSFVFTEAIPGVSKNSKDNGLSMCCCGILKAIFSSLCLHFHEYCFREETSRRAMYYLFSLTMFSTPGTFPILAISLPDVIARFFSKIFLLTRVVCASIYLY
jgi:hypothetical protein